MAGSKWKKTMVKYLTVFDMIMIYTIWQCFMILRLKSLGVKGELGWLLTKDYVRK